MKRVLFVASAVSYFREMAPVVWHFADRGWDVRVLLGSVSPLTDLVVAECGEHDIRVDVAPANVSYGGVLTAAQDNEILAGSAEDAAPIAKPIPSAVSIWLRAAIRKTRLARFLRVPSDWKRMRRIRKFADAFITSAMPDAVFQGAYHSVGQIDNGIGRACDARGIARYCLPNSGYLGRKILQVGRRVHLKTGMANESILVDDNWVNRVFALLFPRWVCEISDGRRSFYWDPVFLFSAWMNGLFFRSLWTKPAFDFNRVFVFSPYSAGLLQSDGYPMDKVMIAGQPLLDTVWQRSVDKVRQEALYRYLKIAPGAPFLLVNIEPSAEHSYCDWEQHWKNFNDLMQAVTRHDLPVVLSLHPLCDAPRYEFCIEKYGVFICKDYKIHDLYPFCAISISFPCSTNLLASVFGKPLVIFDFFGLTTADDDSAFVHALPGAHVAFNGTALFATIATLKSEVAGKMALPVPKILACDLIEKTVSSDIGDGFEAPRLPDERIRSSATISPAAGDLSRKAS